MLRRHDIDAESGVNDVLMMDGDVETQYCDRRAEARAEARAGRTRVGAPGTLIRFPRRRAVAAEKCYSTKFIPLSPPPETMSKVQRAESNPRTSNHGEQRTNHHAQSSQARGPRR